MSGFKEGSLQLRKKDVSTAADQNHLKILVDTNNNLYTVDEYGVYRAVGGYDVQVSGTSLNLVTSGATKILSINDSGVVSGAYGGPTIVASFIVGKDGRIISAANVPISATGLGTVTSVGVASTSLSVSSSPVTTSGTILVNLSAIGTSGVFTKVVKDVYGRITSGGFIGTADITDRSIDGTLSANSDNKIPTEQAVKTYVDENDKRNSVGVCDSVCYDIIDNGDGTATILPQNVYIFDNANFLGNIKKYYVSGNTFTFTDGIEQHVCVKYNSGNPIFYLENNMNAINESDVICVHICWRVGNTIHSMNRDSKGLGLSNKIAKSILKTIPYSISMDGGLILSETSTPTNRTVLITSAVVYAGIVPIDVLSFNSSTDRFTLAYHNAGNWTYSSATVYNNTQYDDGFTLQTIPNNKFAVRWMYRSVGDIKETFYVLGNTYYHNIEEAKLEKPRSDLSLVVKRHCILVGRIIVEYNASVGYVENITDVNFTNASIPNHNDLSNIQGGSLTERYHLSANTYSYLSGVTSDVQIQLDSKLSSGSFDIMKVPTGFPRIDNTSLSFNNSTRIFTLSALSGSFDVYYRGRKFTKTTETIQIPNLSGLHFIYFDSNGVITTSQTPWDIQSTIQITIVYWNGVSAISLGEERHGCVMDCDTHAYLHKTLKTQYVDGFNASYSLSDTSNIIIGLTEGHIADEDLGLYLRNGSINNYLTQPINTSAFIPVYYRQGPDGNGTWKKDVATAYPIKNNGVGANVNYNQLSAGNWIQTPATNNNYVCYFIYATNNIYEPIIAVQGQRQDSNITDANNNANPNSLLFSDFPVAEGKLLYRLIYRISSGYVQNPYNARLDDVDDYRAYSVTVGGTTGGTGTVTSVALSANSILSISGSPIVNAGTLVVDFSNQTSGTFLSGPTSGSASIPTFRRIVSADIPDISNVYTTNIVTSGISANFNSKINSISANYTTRIEVSAVSGNLQTQITNNNNKLSAYLPLSGGTLTGQLNAKYISGDSGALFGLNAQEILRLYRPTSGVTTTFGQTFEANNNVGERVVYARIRSSIYGAVSGLHTGSFLFSVYKNGVEQTPVQILDDQLKVVGTISASGNITAPQFNGNLNGYKNVDNANECTISNGFISSAGNLFINYRGALSAITQYRFCNGLGAVYSGILASAFVKNGGTSAQFLKADGSVDSNVYVLNSSIGNYLLLSGGTLTGQLKGTTISASGNISATIFVGNLNGYKNVDNSNECTISNGFASNQSLYINYRGATSAITQYVFWNGLVSSGTYSEILASSFKKNGGTSAQFLKADGSSDSNVYITSSSLVSYTLTTTTSAISANLQSQITNNNNKLSAYLPLSGGSLTGQLLIKSQLSASGDLIGARHIITGGLSTQFLKADGSVDSNSYALDTLGDYYLPLSGGTLGGDVVSQNIRPTAPFFHDLGSVFFPYASLYVSAINANKINMEGSIIPTNSLLYDLGSNSNKWSKIYTKDITSVAMSTVFDRSVEAVDVKSHILIGFDNQLAPHLNFSTSLGTSATLSGDCFFDGTSLKIRDKNSALKTIAYTSDLSAYTPTSGFNQTISEYLPLSGGTLTGLLKGTSVSASGNMSATNFVGNLNGYKNVDSGNEATISNGYAHSSGELYVNYRGATSAINNYNFCNGKGSTLSTLKAAGATLTGNLKISAVSEGWSEGIKVMVPVNNWGGFRLTRSSSLAGTEDNWSIGYRADSTGDLLFGNYTGGSDREHTIFYKNGNVYHSGNINVSELSIRNSAIITSGSTTNNIRIKGVGNPNNAFIEFGTGSAYFGYLNTFKEFILSGHFNPDTDNVFDIGNGFARWRNIYATNFYENGVILGSKYLPLSGGTMTGRINFSNPNYGNYIGLRGEIGDTDVWGIRGWSVGSNNGYLEIYTEDDGTEPIYVRQYLGSSVKRTLTLLDDLGNTIVPEKLYIQGDNQQNLFIGNDASFGDCDTPNTVRVQGVQNLDQAYFAFGNTDAYFGFDNQRFTINRNLRPTTNGFDLGGLSLNNNWAHVYSEAFVKYGGTSSQFLKADGSVDLNSFSNYLPLAGGTMTGGIYGSGFHSGSIAMLTHDGVASLSQLNVENPSSNLPSNIYFENAAYVGGWSRNTPKNSIFYSSDTMRSNCIVVGDGSLGVNGGIYFAATNNSYIGQTSSDLKLHIKGVFGTTFDGFGDYNITFNEKSIFNYQTTFNEKSIFNYQTTFNNNITLNGDVTNHITYTTANDVGGTMPDGYTYYELITYGPNDLPAPIKSKVIYITHNLSSGPVYIKPPTGTNIYYYNYSGTAQTCDDTQSISILQKRIIMLIGTSSNSYSIIGPAANAN